MTYRILTKKNKDPGVEPHRSELSPGELALNYHDMILYALDDGGNVQQVSSSGGGGSGDLVAMDYTFWVKVVQEGGPLQRFEGVDDNGKPYDVNTSGFDVALNGVSLVPVTDYQIDETALILQEPATAGDVVIIRSLKAADGVASSALTTNDIALLGEDTTLPVPVQYKEWLTRNNLKTQQDANWHLLHKIEDYVRKEGGDSMQGPLDVRPQGNNGRETSKIQTLGVFSNSDQSALRLGTTRDRVYIGHNETEFNGPIKVGEIQEKNVGKGVEFADRVILQTEGVEDDEAVTKKYIDDKTRHLQDEIIELEEEIDAITPSVERGVWTFNLAGVSGNQGQLTMYDDFNGGGQPIGLFKSTKSIWLNEKDNDGTPHGFANVGVGELVELFVEGEPDYGLFTVVAVHDETSGVAHWWVLDVEFVRALEDMSMPGNGENVRVKIVQAPSGGEATSFVIKSGDTMTGNLNIDRSDESASVEAELTLKGSRSESVNPAATITFVNEQSTAQGEIAYRSYDASSWFGFNRDIDLNNKGLHTVAQIRLKPDGYIGSQTNPRLTFHNANSGNDGDGLLVVPRPVDNRRSFAIRGKNADGDEKDMLYSFSNASTPDAVNYEGKIESEANLVNKAYVDKKVLEPQNQIPSFEKYPVMLQSGNGYVYKFVDKGILSSSQFSSDSHQASGSYLYLHRLWGQKRGWTQVVNYDRTQNSVIEVYEADSGTPVLVLKAGINKIEQAEWSQDDAKLSLNRFWSKPGYSFSKFKEYSFMIHGLTEREVLISPLSLPDDEVS